MTDYTKSTNFASKDSLPAGSALKIVKGTEIDTEFNNIATAIATKADYLNATLTTPTITTPTITGGTITGITDLAVADGGTGASTAANARTNLGLAIGTDVQAYNSNLTTWASKTAPSGTVVGTSDSQTVTNKVISTGCSLGVSLLTSGTAQASTSGTSIDFTGIPSWVKRITVIFNGVSTNGTSQPQVQLGISSGIQTTGYLSGGSQASAGTNSTTGLLISGFNGAADIRYGKMEIVSFGSNQWVSSCVVGLSNTGLAGLAGGSVTIGGTLDRIRITTVNGTDTFDAGSINILYE